MIFVDSSVWIDHFNGRVTAQVAWLRAALGGEQHSFVVGDLILLEVLQGFRHERHFESTRAALLLLPCMRLGGPERCVRAAKHYRRLRARGVTIRSPIDVLIATCCIDERAVLLHSDRDFDLLAVHLGLRLVTTS